LREELEKSIYLTTHSVIEYVENTFHQNGDCAGLEIMICFVSCCQQSYALHDQCFGEKSIKSVSVGTIQGIHSHLVTFSGGLPRTQF